MVMGGSSIDDATLLRVTGQVRLRHPDDATREYYAAEAQIRDIDNAIRRCVRRRTWARARFIAARYGMSPALDALAVGTPSALALSLIAIFAQWGIVAALVLPAICYLLLGGGVLWLFRDYAPDEADDRVSYRAAQLGAMEREVATRRLDATQARERLNAARALHPALVAAIQAWNRQLMEQDYQRRHEELRRQEEERQRQRNDRLTASPTSPPPPPDAWPECDTGRHQFWRSLGWWDFEIAVLLVFEHCGAKIIATTPCNDGGLDGIIDGERGRAGVQCKHYGRNEKVGVEEIRAFRGALLNAHLSHGVFVTTGIYSRTARAEAEKSVGQPAEIKLIMTDNLISMSRGLKITVETMRSAKTRLGVPDCPPPHMPQGRKARRFAGRWRRRR